MKPLFLSLFIILLCSCSFDNAFDSRIAKLGPVALSDSNPYIASNLYLAERIRSSNVLAGFIKYRGMPSVIEVDSHFFRQNSLLLYYPNTQEYYIIDGKEGRSIITGPFNIPAEKLPYINRVSSEFHGQPALLEGGNVQVINNDSNSFPKEEVISNKINEAESDVNKIKRLQQNSDLATGEVTDKGDLVHYVTFEGETLSLIARWYTYDTANIGRIVRVNNIKDPDNLQLGDEILIPKYMLKTKKCFGEYEFNELK